ncbi:DUF1642 domain-containing protein, partial [Enterococcus mundtii]|uniref:DUF1642 domain-containing protein n=1 Tax=Enterococcus mundtii TaxID=53346 RepID=UPI001E2C9FAB
MDIKELITRIEKIKYGNLCYNSPESMLLEQKHLILDLVEQLDEPPITDEQAWNKIAEAYPDSPQSLRNTLDNAVFGKASKSQKTVVPKFVAEWIEYAKKKGDSLAISFKPWTIYGVEYSKTDRWIEDNQETFARAWLDGYEVKKEPMYYVILSENKGGWKYTFLDEEGSADYTNNKAHIPTFTEKEIKGNDERFWPFSVPVKEV